jgi:hypothetical protein
MLDVQAADLTAREGFFSSVSTCPALEDILTATPDPSLRLGNFTVRPSRRLLQECLSSSAVHLTASMLGDALAQPTPLVKVRACPAHPRNLGPCKRCY